jgi:hypothetical protein
METHCLLLLLKLHDVTHQKEVNNDGNLKYHETLCVSETSTQYLDVILINLHLECLSLYLRHT